jgi:hypothetical protein
MTKSKSDTVEVVALVDIHSGPPEFPVCTHPGEKVELPREQAMALVADGKAAVVTGH